MGDWHELFERDGSGNILARDRGDGRGPFFRAGQYRGARECVRRWRYRRGVKKARGCAYESEAELGRGGWTLKLNDSKRSQIDGTLRSANSRRRLQRSAERHLYSELPLRRRAHDADDGGMDRAHAGTRGQARDG